MTSEIRSTSTRAFFERATHSMGSLRGQAEKLQTQISTGGRLSKSSDDPLAAAQLRSLARKQSLSSVDKTSTDRADADLQLADGALGAMASLVTRAQELTVQAGSAALGNDQRISIGKELAGLRESLLALANSRDSAGNALFGGGTADAAYTLDASGNAVYQGAATSDQLDLGGGQTVTRGLTGPEFLTSGPGGAPVDLLAAMKGLSEALQVPTGDTAAAARAGLAQLETGLQAITTAQTVIGARMTFVDMATDRREALGELRTVEESTLGSTDIAATVARLQETMLVLEASQASFARLSGLSLLDALR